MVGAGKRYLWRHPSGRIYVRLKGTLHRIAAAAGTAEFDLQYWEVLTGNPISDRYMADLMLKERKRLGLEAYDLHALRYRGVKELAWAGCDDDEIAA